MTIELDQDNSGAIDISLGGTNATTATEARKNLGACPAVMDTLSDLKIRVPSQMSAGVPLVATVPYNKSYQAYTASAVDDLVEGFTPTLTDDENYVSDAEKVKIGNLPENTQALIDSISGGSSYLLKIAIIGDSITQPHAFSDSWPSQLQESCNQMGLDVDIADWAINGATFYKALTDTTAHESGTKTQVQQCIDQGADIVFVALGINDSLYANTRTQAQIIQDGTDVYNALKAGLPDARIIIIHEAPHNFESLGVVPSVATNANVVPFSHQKITYLGRSNCRVNNTTFSGTSVSATALANHQRWGNVANAMSAIYDGYITVNMWKIARIGCYVDLLHPDGFGHMWFSVEVLKWLATNNGVDNDVLNSIELRTNGLFMDLDTFYAEMITGTMSGYSISVANYAGYDLPNARNNWMFAQRRLFGGIGPLTTNSAADTLHQYFRGAHPGVTVYFSWGGADFASSGKTTSAEGVFMDSYAPVTVAASLSWDVAAGIHAIAYAFALADGSHDVFEGTVNYAVTVAPGDSSSSAELTVDGVAKLTAAATTLTQPNGVSTFFGSSGTANPVQIFGTLELGSSMTTAANIAQQASTGQNSFYAATYVYNTLIANALTTSGTMSAAAVNASGTATVNALKVGTSGSTHNAEIWGKLDVTTNIADGGSLAGASVGVTGAASVGTTLSVGSTATVGALSTSGAITANNTGSVHLISGVLKAYGGFGGNGGASGTGIKIADNAGNFLSFNYTGGNLQFLIGGSVVKTI